MFPEESYEFTDRKTKPFDGRIPPGTPPMNVLAISKYGSKCIL
jgi:hypothetical protein